MKKSRNSVSMSKDIYERMSVRATKLGLSCALYVENLIRRDLGMMAKEPTSQPRKRKSSPPEILRDAQERAKARLKCEHCQDGLSSDLDPVTGIRYHSIQDRTSGRTHHEVCLEVSDEEPCRLERCGRPRHSSSR